MANDPVDWDIPLREATFLSPRGEDQGEGDHPRPDLPVEHRGSRGSPSPCLSPRGEEMSRHGANAAAARLAWALTGSGHFFTECLGYMSPLQRFDLFVSKAAAEVIRMYQSGPP